jgi:hypothetical protein
MENLTRVIERAAGALGGDVLLIWTGSGRST